MEHIFLIHSNGSDNRTAQRLIPQIRAAAAQTGTVCLIREWQQLGDIETAVCRDAARGGSMRFYVSGSDAELCAAARVASGFENAEIGILPDARGCDFARGFSGDFSDIRAQLRGESRPMDMIDCNGQHLLSSLRLLTQGSSLSRPSFHIPSESLAIACDDGDLFTGAFSFAAVSNGKFTARQQFFPDAVPNDGLMDLMLLRTLPVRKLLVSKSAPYCIRKRARRVVILAQEPILVCGDGQEFRVLRLVLSVVPNCVRFIIPASDAHCVV